MRRRSKENKPIWNKESGELFFSKYNSVFLIRKVSPRATAIREVLDAFEASGWQRIIDDPALVRRADEKYEKQSGSFCHKQRVAGSVRSLNSRLISGIVSFHQCNNGMSYKWVCADDFRKTNWQ
jgi:hypothetical protein